MVGCHLRTWQASSAPPAYARSTREEVAIRRRADELLHYVGIADRADDLARTPYGDLPAAEIARALLATLRPRLGTNRRPG